MVREIIVKYRQIYNQKFRQHEFEERNKRWINLKENTSRIKYSSTQYLVTSKIRREWGYYQCIDCRI